MMKDKITKSVIFVLIFQLSFLIDSPVIQAKNRNKPRISALIITGQNNHYWRNSTPIFKTILEDAEIFRVDIAKSPAQGEDMSVFNPVFSDYDVVVLDYNVDTRASKHPIMKGFPSSWKHAKDELYHMLRGPAENMEILATSYSDKKKNGTGRHEPILFTVRYGEGRIFHTVMGHVGENETVAV